MDHLHWRSLQTEIANVSNKLERLFLVGLQPSLMYAGRARSLP
jgi:hypothetical protein